MLVNISSENGENAVGGTGYTLMRGDCLERMCEIPDHSIDAVITDPPYG